MRLGIFKLKLKIKFIDKKYIDKIKIKKEVCLIISVIGSSSRDYIDMYLILLAILIKC